MRGPFQRSYIGIYFRGYIRVYIYRGLEGYIGLYRAILGYIGFRV